MYRLGVMRATLSSVSTCPEGERLAPLPPSGGGGLGRIGGGTAGPERAGAARGDRARAVAILPRLRKAAGGGAARPLEARRGPDPRAFRDSARPRRVTRDGGPCRRLRARRRGRSGQAPRGRLLAPPWCRRSCRRSPPCPEPPRRGPCSRPRTGRRRGRCRCPLALHALAGWARYSS